LWCSSAQEQDLKEATTTILGRKVNAMCGCGPYSDYKCADGCGKCIPVSANFPLGEICA
ncbi:hypothetical protein HAX54_013336, partial [Datura stramonium]|nr:hypothetical protein [Datura stramonium]